MFTALAELYVRKITDIFFFSQTPDFSEIFIHPPKRNNLISHQEKAQVQQCLTGLVIVCFFPNEGAFFSVINKHPCSNTSEWI